MKVPPLHRDSNKCSLDGAILRRGGHPRATLSSKMRRGGACVPARTSAQRHFHTKNTRIVRREFNDGCALVGRHGRAHRHRPYQTPSYFSVQSYHNQQPLRPRFCKTIHHLEMNERQYAPIRHRFPDSENMNIIVSATDIQCTPRRLISPIGGCSVYLCTG